MGCCCIQSKVFFCGITSPHEICVPRGPALREFNYYNAARWNEDRLRFGAGDESRDYGDSVRPTFGRLASAFLELDPTFIETVEHPHAGFRVPHALRPEQFFPRCPGHRHRTHRLCNDAREGVGEVVGRYATGALKLDDTYASPIPLNEVRRHPPNVLRGNHRKRLVRWQQEAVNETRLAGRRHVPRNIIDEPGGPEDGKRQRKLA